MIKRIIIILLLQGAIAPCNSLFGQQDEIIAQSKFLSRIFDGNNRFSIQTGLFHQFFDGTPVINSERLHENLTFIKNPMRAWGSRINDSWGFTYRRKINEKSALLLERMVYKASYIGLFTEWSGPPRIRGRRLDKYSLTYLRLIPIHEKMDFNIGVGVSYQWGREGYKLSPPPYPDDFYDKYNFVGERKDLGFNLKSNFDYTPIKQLTLSVGVDWTRSVFSENKDYRGINTYDFFVEEYNMTQFPSKNNLSFNLAVGFNF